MKALLLIGLMCMAAGAQETARRPAASAAHEHRPAADLAAPTNAAQAELQALTADLERMKALLQQMQMNLAFVTSGQNPLKHQFELEADMWATLISSMERRLQILREQAGTPPQPAPAAPKPQS